MVVKTVLLCFLKQWSCLIFSFLFGLDLGNTMEFLHEPTRGSNAAINGGDNASILH